MLVKCAPIFVIRNISSFLWLPPHKNSNLRKIVIRSNFVYILTVLNKCFRCFKDVLQISCKIILSLTLFKNFLIKIKIGLYSPAMDRIEIKKSHTNSHLGLSNDLRINGIGHLLAIKMMSSTNGQTRRALDTWNSVR